MSTPPKVIEVTVSPAGEVTVLTRGFAGSECRSASRYLEEALGTRSSERLTSEFYQPAAAEQHERQHAG